jgi:rhomboid protease GluP
MSESPLEAILRLCAAAAPVPWYPKDGAATLGLTDDDLAAFVEQLRSGGLIARTDPVPGYGRGYVLTPLGAQALRDPGDLEWLRRGEIPPRKSPPTDGAPAAVSERERAVRKSLLAPFSAYVTYTLIGINVAVFVWGVYLGRQRGLGVQSFLTSAPEDIMRRTGAVDATDLAPPGWGLLRLLTCCFVHYGLVHLAVNMVSLHLVGPLLERLWGHVRFLVLYLIAGLGGSCAAMVLKPLGAGGNLVMLAGASGALWGLLASMAVWIVLNYRHMPRRLFSSWGVQIGIVFVINVAITYYGRQFISAEAHYGGGAVGAVCALLLHFVRFGPLAVRAAATAAVAALPVLGLYAVTHPARFNPRREADEKALEQAVEKRRKDRDFREMNDQVMPQVKEMEKEALRHAPDAAEDPVINRNAGRRDPESVKRGIEAYGEAEAALRPAADLLRRAGPYQDAEVENARQMYLELVEARLELFDLNKRCLEAGKDWKEKEEARREEAIRRVRQLTP